MRVNVERMELAEAILFDRLDLEWCELCKEYTETDYVMTLAAGIDGPEEGIHYCVECRRER